MAFSGVIVFHSKVRIIGKLIGSYRRCRHSISCFSSVAKSISESSFSKGRWQLAASVIIQRLPVTTAEPLPLEMEYQKTMLAIESENSLKSDHELTHEDDLRKKAAQRKAELEGKEKDGGKKKKKSADANDEGAIIQSAQDIEDECNEEYNKFKGAERITEADMKKDYKSLWRSLDRRLTLTVQKSKLNSEKVWMLPYQFWTEGETLKQTADRALRDVLEPKVEYRLLGNSPIAVYNWPFPKSTKGVPSNKLDYIGCKLFFYKAQLVYKPKLFNSANPVVVEKAGNCAWLTKDEIKDKLTAPDRYKRVVDDLIFDEYLVKSFSNAAVISEPSFKQASDSKVNEKLAVKQ